MDGPIRVLHVDDDPAFAEMAGTFLERADERFDVAMVTSTDEALDRLEATTLDCVVSDYDMPGRNGLDLLAAVRARDPDVPFLLFTGKGSEEVASEAISAGVTDYLQKEDGPDQFTVLANRVANAVDRRRAEREAEQTRTLLETISENSHDVILVVDADGIVRFANPATEELLGYPTEELVGGPLTAVIPERYRESHREALVRYLETGERSISWRSTQFEARHRAGHEVPVSLSLGEFETDGEPRFLGILRDDTERKARAREREAWVEFFQHVYRVTAASDLPLGEKVGRLLSAGCERLGLPYGFLTRIEREEGVEGTQTIVEATGSHELLQPGESCPLPQSYCRKTVAAGGFLSVVDAAEAGWVGDPAYETFGLESYVGATVTVDGELYGTLCFASGTPREEPFDETESSFVRLVADWVGLEMGREPEAAERLG